MHCTLTSDISTGQHRNLHPPTNRHRLSTRHHFQQILDHLNDFSCPVSFFASLRVVRLVAGCHLHTCRSLSFSSSSLLVLWLMEPSSFVHGDDLNCNHIKHPEISINNFMVGLKALSTKVKAGEVVTEDHTIPLPAKSNYSLHSSFKFM